MKTTKIRRVVFALTWALSLSLLAVACPRPTPKIRQLVAESTTSSVYVGCSGPADCDTAIASRGLACARSVGCIKGECQFAVDTASPSCSCFESDVRLCPEDPNKIQFCVESPGGVTAWQKTGSANTCGPSRVACETGISECPSGYRKARFDGTGWTPTGACIAEPACPAAGAIRTCSSGNPKCQEGRQTWDGARWGACVAINCPPPTFCEPGSSQRCEADGCAGSQSCDASGNSWGACSAPPRCPAGWQWNGSVCSWTSPNEGSHVSYFPHRAENEKIAATGAIGAPYVGGAPQSVYVEARLSQWSNPPAPGGGNYCGKGSHVSAWVGCIHPNGSLGWGRDTPDVDWVRGEMIPLKCDPGDTVGIYKHSWGHDWAWHCARDVHLTVVRNHDPIATCSR